MYWTVEGLKPGDVVWIGDSSDIRPYSVTRITKSAVFVQLSSYEARYNARSGVPTGDDNFWGHGQRSLQRDGEEIRKLYRGIITEARHTRRVREIVGQLQVSCRSTRDTLALLQSFEETLKNDLLLAEEREKEVPIMDSVIKSFLAKVLSDFQRNKGIPPVERSRLNL
jgi:hypothetical protein